MKKYVNGRDIFPAELLDMIQNHTQGRYVYIPKREEMKEKWGTKTSYRQELHMRNNHIFDDFLRGFTIESLSDQYNLSSKSIRRIILEKRKESVMTKQTINTILSHWNLQEDARQIHESAWAIGDSYVLKTNESKDHVERNITIMKTLNDGGIPVARPIPTKNGLDYLEHEGIYYLVMNQLPGNHVLDIYTSDYALLAYDTGKIVANLHQAFLLCEKKIPLRDMSLLKEMQSWIQTVLREQEFRYLSEADYEAVARQLTQCYDALPRQLIHRDFHFGNILFDKGLLSGYVDFDLSQKNARVFDLCYFLAGLLVGHERKKDDVAAWFHIVSRFVQGYEETNLLSTLEKESIPCLMKSIEILFVAYFIRIGDEELAKGSADVFYWIAKHEQEIHDAIKATSTSEPA